jgi:hypothetical protein
MVEENGGNLCKNGDDWPLEVSFGEGATHTLVNGAKESRPEGRLNLCSERDQVNARHMLTGTDRPGAHPTFAACDP